MIDCSSEQNVFASFSYGNLNQDLTRKVNIDWTCEVFFIVDVVVALDREHFGAERINWLKLAIGIMLGQHPGDQLVEICREC